MFFQCSICKSKTKLQLFYTKTFQMMYLLLFRELSSIFYTVELNDFIIDYINFNINNLNLLISRFITTFTDLFHMACNH